MNYFKDFFSGKPLKINRPADDDAEWFNNSASMEDIFAYGAEHHPEFTDEQYRERILEIYKLIKTHSEEAKNASDYMMCSKELGLPGDIVYLECAPFLMIDPVFEEVSREDSPTDFKAYPTKLQITLNEGPMTLLYNVPETLHIRYNDIDLNEHVIMLSGATCMRFILCAEYMTGFHLLKKFEQEISSKEVEKPVKKWYSFLPFTKKAS